MILGSHVSVAGGPAAAFEHAAAIGCDAVQIFVKPPRKLRGVKPFTPEQLAAWEAARAASAVSRVVVHANYLINLAGTGHTGQYSREAFLDEMKRCHELGVDTLIFHPGKALGATPGKALGTIAKNLRWCLDRGKDYDGVTLCIENMAGQGTEVCADLAQVRTLLDLVARPERMGMCLDTCHAFAAGHDLRTPAAYAKTMEMLDATVGLGAVKAFHLNDAKQGLASHADRHEQIGKGKLGDEAFRLLLQDHLFRDVPGVLETPHEDDKGFKKDLDRLRRLEKA